MKLNHGFEEILIHSNCEIRYKLLACFNENIHQIWVKGTHNSLLLWPVAGVIDEPYSQLTPLVQEFSLGTACYWRLSLCYQDQKQFSVRRIRMTLSTELSVYKDHIRFICFLWLYFLDIVPKKKISLPNNRKFYNTVSFQGSSSVGSFFILSYYLNGKSLLI